MSPTRSLWASFWAWLRAPRSSPYLDECRKKLPEVSRVRLVPYACKLCPKAVNDGDLVVTVWTPWPVTVHAECIHAVCDAVESAAREVSR